MGWLQLKTGSFGFLHTFWLFETANLIKYLDEDREISGRQIRQPMSQKY